MRKRVLPLFLALVMCFGLAVPALAANSDFVIEDGVLTQYTGRGGEMVIPDGVTSIGAYVFYERGISTVTIPDSVTSIESGAFGHCNLESITIPAGVTSIGDRAFDRCIFLESVTILNGDAEIGDKAFCYYSEFMNEIISGLTVYAPAGGAVEAYCEEWGIPFVALAGTPADGTGEPTETETPGEPAAISFPQEVQVDGKAVTFYTYALADKNGGITNYMKLRDVAALLSGTAAQFQVGWDGSINLETGKAYTAVGGEMEQTFEGDKPYIANDAQVNINGVPTSLEAITLWDDEGGNYNYFKLRDLGQALGFNVGWSADKGIFIETDKAYTDAD